MVTEDGAPRKPGPIFGDEELWVEAFKVNRIREVEEQEKLLLQGASAAPPTLGDAEEGPRPAPPDPPAGVAQP